MIKQQMATLSRSLKGRVNVTEIYFDVIHTNTVNNFTATF